MYVVNFLHFSGLFSNSIMQGQVKLRGSRKSPSWGWSLHLVSLATTWFFVHYCAKEYRRESGTPFSTWYAQLIAFWSFTYSLTIAITKANIENIVRHGLFEYWLSILFFWIIEQNSNFKISFYYLGQFNGNSDCIIGCQLPIRNNINIWKDWNIFKTFFCRFSCQCDNISSKKQAIHNEWGLYPLLTFKA